MRDFSRDRRANNQKIAAELGSWVKECLEPRN